MLEGDGDRELDRPPVEIGNRHALGLGARTCLGHAEHLCKEAVHVGWVRRRCRRVGRGRGRGRLFYRLAPQDALRECVHCAAEELVEAVTREARHKVADECWCKSMRHRSPVERWRRLAVVAERRTDRQLQERRYERCGAEHGARFFVPREHVRHVEHEPGIACEQPARVGEGGGGTHWVWRAASAAKRALNALAAHPGSNQVVPARVRSILEREARD